MALYANSCYASRRAIELTPSAGVWIGYAIAACFVCMTGRIGATYHISFPVATRSSFGIWGSLWPVLNRAAMACVWYGVQAWIGGECVALMIGEQRQNLAVLEAHIDIEQVPYGLLGGPTKPSATPSLPPATLPPRILSASYYSGSVRCRSFGKSLRLPPTRINAADANKVPCT